VSEGLLQAESLVTIFFDPPSFNIKGSKGWFFGRDDVWRLPKRFKRPKMHEISLREQCSQRRLSSFRSDACEVREVARGAFVVRLRKFGGVNIADNRPMSMNL
jgi:hypothetical protein